MSGFDVRGWDCHGLLIEIKLINSWAVKNSRWKLEVREARQNFSICSAEQFKRIGVFGRWDDPYSTMTPQYESVAAGHVLRLPGKRVRL